MIREDVLTSKLIGNDEFYLNVREDEVGPTPVGDFEFVQHEENATRSDNI